MRWCSLQAIPDCCSQLTLRPLKCTLAALKSWRLWPSTGHPEQIGVLWTVLVSRGQRVLGLPPSGLSHYSSWNFSPPFGVIFFGSVPDYFPTTLLSPFPGNPWLSLPLPSCAGREFESSVVLPSFHRLVLPPSVTMNVIFKFSYSNPTWIYTNNFITIQNLNSCTAPSPSSVTDVKNYIFVNCVPNHINYCF